VRIRRIEVRDFRALLGTHVVSDLEDGLTILSGQNEDGKSTLLAAVRTVLFERYKVGGQVAESLLPFGSRVRPEIRVDFRIGDRDYSIFKAFCQRPEAVLTTPEGEQHGDEAEEELGRLLGAQIPGRGPSKLEHRGVWGMLWVEQGRGFEALEPSAPARASMQSTLQRELGSIVGADAANRLLERIEERRSRFFDKRGLVRGELKESRKRLQELQEELRDVEGELASYQTQVDALEDALEQKLQLTRTGALQAAEQRVERARASQAEVQALQAVVAEAKHELDLCEANLQRVMVLHRQRQQWLSSATQLTGASEAEAKQARLLRLELGELAAKHRDAKAACDAEKEALEGTQERLELALSRREVAHDAEQLRRLKKRLRAARRYAKAASSTASRIALIPVDEAKMAALREAHARAETCEARLDGAAASVIVRTGKHLVRMSGEPVPQGETLRLLEPCTLSIEGVGSIEVFPGGELLEQRVTERDEARAEYAKQLQALGFRSLEEAAQALQSRQALQSELWESERMLKFEASEGTDVLQAEIDTLKTRLDERVEQLRLGDTPKLDECELDVQRLRGASELRKAEAALAAQRMSEIDARLTEAKHKLVQAEAKAEAREEHMRQARNQLQEARASQSDESLQSALLEATAKKELRTRELETSRKSLAEMDPDGRESELEEALRLLEELRERSRQLEQRIRDTRIHLSAGGRAGLGERREELRALLAEERLRSASLERDAKATDLLARVLREASEDAQRHFAEPVRRRVEPYLSTLMPEAELQIDADLRIRGLRRNDREEPFEALSVGTREQLAVLARLAFADILHDDGRPTPVLLDDVLVYSDDDRFDRMKAILKRASERQQVLVFTCRERDWADCGAPIVRLGSPEPRQSRLVPRDSRNELETGVEEPGHNASFS
jgi:DNA repair exonuclease SbcCD ATPase subunit